MQIFGFDGDRFEAVEEIADFVHRGFGARADSGAFQFAERSALFASIEFVAGRLPVRGYGFYYDGMRHDFAVFGFVPSDSFEQYHDFLLSAIDTFSPSVFELRRPGPVSEFLHPTVQGVATPQTLSFDNKQVHFTIDTNATGASQALIEREARVLATYTTTTDLWLEAWQRYYRIIYRDNYRRLQPLAVALREHFQREGASKAVVAADLLDWLQQFRYERNDTLSDLTAPIVALLERAGDCDSLGLLYIILLEHLDYDTLLLVSTRHAHSLVGIDVKGAGARYDFQGRAYLLAELTEKVPIGQIARSMADAPLLDSHPIRTF